MSPNQKSLLSAAVIILSLAIAIPLLMQSGSASGVRISSITVEPSPSPSGGGGETGATAGSLESRRAYAQTLAKRYSRSPEVEVKATAAGPEGKVLELTWPRQMKSSPVVQRLHRAAPFLREARSYGFERVRMLSGKEELWSRDLRDPKLRLGPPKH
jgi:hypothetical protein